ncbi:CLUMA_CG006621, isoform A [Clunio marinus]|uniref:CLUMA_CG006621, isoform A n=1 Tax=Clunio marinus TaxID=568069 RepID=A0A1J1I3R0_9DIPT|nr:CLUMA_CG006621, isoform A [Clunio marinus]
MFIDRIITSQSFSLDNGRNNIVETIKVEPIVEPNPQFESELKFHNKTPSVHVANLGQPDFNERIEMNHLTPQKKCEILEIVDIKPFNFNMTINHEPYDEEDDIQILSPKQLKVELTDPDDVGGNELEQIRNYIFVSTVFLQDHNYSCNSVPLRSIDNNVKMEHEDCGEERFNADHESSHNLSIDAPIVKHCDLCKKSFKTPKEYIVHKIISHQRRNATKTLYCPNCRKKYCNNIVKLNIHKKICVKNVGRTNKKLFVRKEVTKKSFTKMIRKPQSRKKDSYVCPTCSKVFSGPKNLYQHKVSHTNIHYSCNLCNKKFKRPHGLRQHVKSIHEKNKKHICPICNYRYLLKADMIKCKHSKLKQIYIE